MYTHVCFHVCSVVSCYIWMFCIYFVCIYMYVFMYMYICICVYICMCICTHICLCLCSYMLVQTFICIKVIYLSLTCRYLRCYLLVLHCYLGSILVFSFDFQNLNAIICTKTSNKSTYVTKIVYFVHVFIYLNKFWLIDDCACVSGS